MLRSLIVVCLVALPACQRPPASTNVEKERGLVWLFPGVEGGERSMRFVYDALRDGGVDSAIEIHDWETPFGTFVNLMSHDRNRRDALLVAGEIAKYKRQHPDCPVDIVGYSGGGGMAVMTAEALPEGVSVRNVVLVHPAVSPDYDLSGVLSHIDGSLVNYYSVFDWLILGAGTGLFGTMDRRYCASAGKNGFDVEKAVPNPVDRQKLVQRAWTLEMVNHGHLGGHGTILIYGWNREYVVPWLAGEGIRFEMLSDVPLFSVFD